MGGNKGNNNNYFGKSKGKGGNYYNNNNYGKGGKSFGKNNNYTQNRAMRGPAGQNLPSKRVDREDTDLKGDFDFEKLQAMEVRKEDQTVLEEAKQTKYNSKTSFFDNFGAGKSQRELASESEAMEKAKAAVEEPKKEEQEVVGA